jgi:hypothetical protein
MVCKELVIAQEDLFSAVCGGFGCHSFAHFISSLFLSPYRSWTLLTILT